MLSSFMKKYHTITYLNILFIYVFYRFILYSSMNEISLNGIRICLKVSILFKTDTLAKMLAPHNAHLVKSNHSYVEVFVWVPTTST